MFTTYGIIDPTTKHFVYVGQTSDFEKRRRQHLTTHRQKKTRHKKGSLQAWLVQAHAAKITPVFIVLDLVETEALSLDSETHWIEKLSQAGYQLLNRWEEHKELIEAGQGREAELFDSYRPGKWRKTIATMKPTPKGAGYEQTFPEKVTMPAGSRLIILPTREDPE